MARRGMRHGECALCGAVGDLTFEHVPPAKAFNNLRAIGLSWDEALRLGPDTPVKGKIEQGGIGGYTLCPTCNNNTGGWYARSLIDWCYRGMMILERSRGQAGVFHMRRIHPLRVLKQIMVMFCSVNRKLTTAQSWLRKLLLNRYSQEWAEGWRVFVYYNIEGKLRYMGGASRFDLVTGTSTLLSEINYPPFGYVLLMDGSLPDGRLTDISCFVRYGYDDVMSDVILPMSVLPTHLLYPGDYRSRDEIAADAQRARGTEPS